MKKIKSFIFFSLLIFILTGQTFAKAKLDYRNLPDGEYSVKIEVRKDFYIKKPKLSMMDDAVEKPASIVVENGNYFLKFKMLPLELAQFKAKGYLGDINYIDSKNNENKVEVLKYYDFEDELSKKYNLKYPETIMYPIEKENISKIQETRVKVFVPIMEEIGKKGEEMGTQYARPTIYWDTLQEKNSNEFVNINLADTKFAQPKLRKIVDQVGKIVEYQGEKYLYINFFNLKLDSSGYDDGTETLEYSYGEDQTRYSLQSKVIEEGKIGGRYQLSEAYIPIDGAEEIYLYGKFQTTKYKQERYEQSAKINLSLLTPAKSNSDDLKLEFVKQDDVSVKKNKSNKLPYDFNIGGVLYSPYTSIDGNKFRLTRDGENVRFIFNKNSFITSNIRNIKYTLDGSEPNESSFDADLSFYNQSKFHDDSYYNVEIDPFNMTNISSMGGNVTLKVKAFDKNGMGVGNTQTYVIPYDKETISEVKGDTMPYLGCPMILSTGKKAALPKNSMIYAEELSDYNMQEELNNLAEEEGIYNPSLVKLSLYDGNKPLELNYNGSWNANVCPLATVKLKGNNLGNYFAYEYKDGKLIPLATKASPRELVFNISSNQGYYVIGQVDKNSVRKMAINLLSNKIKEAEAYLNSGEVNLYSLILEGDIEKAKNDLGKFKTPYICLSGVEKIERTMNLAKSSGDESPEFYKEKAKVLVQVANEILNKNILNKSSENELQGTRDRLQYAISNNDLNSLRDSIKNLDKALNNLSYKGKGQAVNINILKENSNQRSMASNVFENQGKLLQIDGKYYLELGLKTMYFGNIRAHLLDLEVFENGLGSRVLNLTPISKFSDTGLQGVEFYNKKILIELGDRLSSEYYIRVKNDAMGNARPVARLTINY